VSGPTLVTAGILKPEVMLRQAQAQIDELRQYVAMLEAQVRQLDVQVKDATRSFATLVVQCGGEVLIERAEWSKPFTLQRREDPVTHDRTWMATRPPIVVQPGPAGTQ